MLAEFTWDKNTTFLGIVACKHRDIAVLQTTPIQKSSFPLLCDMFDNLDVIVGYEEDLEHLNDQTSKKCVVVYLPTFECPEETSEDVTLLLEKKLILDKDGEEIKITKLSLNKFESFGFDIFEADGLLLEKADLFHKHIQKTLKKNDRTVNGRKIYYILENNKFDFISHSILDLIKERLHCDEIEMWNAFISVVPANTSLKNQTVHRDCLSKSISLFFYLDDITFPQTQFFPFTHRILSNVTTSVVPNLLKHQILMMNGLLLHGGMQGKPTENRTLYVLQYRDKNETRQMRVHQAKKLQICIDKQKPIFKTVFKN